MYSSANAHSGGQARTEERGQEPTSGLRSRFRACRANGGWPNLRRQQRWQVMRRGIVPQYIRDSPGTHRSLLGLLGQEARHELRERCGALREQRAAGRGAGCERCASNHATHESGSCGENGGCPVSKTNNVLPSA